MSFLQIVTLNLVTLNIAGIHGRKDLKTEMVSIKINEPHPIVQSIEAFVHPSISLETQITTTISLS